MNERLGRIGDQLKNAGTKVVETWQKQEAARKKLIIGVALGLLVFAVGLVVILNIVGGRYVVLYESMSQDESVQAKGVLETAGITSRLNGDGKLEVPSNQVNAAMGQLAIQGIPSTSLDYSIIEGASGLMTTETEKRDAQVRQTESNLQDIIKTYTDVQNAFVKLNINTSSDRVWDVNAGKNSASVTVHMRPGRILGSGQVSGIRFLVGSSAGIDPAEVTVLDGDGNLLAAPGEAYDAKAAVISNFMQRMDLQRAVEEEMARKAVELLSLPYPDPASYRVVPTVQLNFDAMMTEIKEYIPLEGTIHGVVDQEEIDAVMGLGQYAAGVVGETDNTDVPIYVDYDGDENPDSVDFHRYRDYAVSYTLQQIEKESPSIELATVAILLNDTPTAETVQQLRVSISNALGLDLENVSVQSMAVAPPTPPVTITWWQNIFGENASPLIPFILLGVVVVLVIVLVLVLVLRGRRKKKRLAAEAALAEAEREEAERIQQEIEERKRQLKSAAFADESENAITNEVKEFARNNPEITANLLRNWIREGE